ncbi:hypothetical protein BDR03DRAFT_984167 [Suillus americanus]|nr:hypothetical protein BDR03DRAFT_984167 [Suillus americanus]
MTDLKFVDELNCERQNSGDLQPCIIINDPDPIDPREIFKKLHLEHIKHLVRVSEHNFDRVQMAEHYKEQLNRKLDDKTRKGSGKKQTKPYSRVLTSEEGCAELRELEADQAERKHQEEVSKQKKVAEEWGKHDRRDQDQELRDIAAALRLPETGLKAELLQRILQHFNDHPELKKNQCYEAMHLHIIQCTILYLVLHLFFTLTLQQLVDLSLMYDIGGSGNAGHQLHESGLYQQYHYNPNNYYMNHDPQ